jgi:hypothetical protein
MVGLSAEAEAYGRALCDIGIKYAGTPCELQARDFIVDSLKDLGYEPVLEPFEYLNYQPESASVEVQRPSRESFRAEPLQFAASAECEGELIYVGDGSKAQFDHLASCGADFRGKIVITSGWPPFMLYRLAEERGAVGYIVITRPPAPLIAVGCAVQDPREGTIPAVTVGSDDGHRLLALQAAGPVHLRLRCRGRFSRATSANILVDIPGSDCRDEKVTVCSHYDSQCKGSHAWDNVSGDIALLAIARAVTELRPKRTLQLYFCGVEEQGMCSGSRVFVEKRARDMQNFVAVINLDGISSVLCPRNIIQATPEALEFALGAARAVGWRVDGTPSLQPNSDHASFVEAGVPAIWAHEGPRSPFQHTEADTFDYLDMRKLLAASSVNAHCALELACDAALRVPRPKQPPWQVD